MKPDRPLRPLWLRATCLSALALVLACITWSQMLLASPATQDGDGEFFQRLIEAGKWSLLRYHELPLWNPYECGGIPLWDSPQSIVAAPLVLLSTPLSSLHTLWVWYIGHAALGFVGMWLLARHELGVTRPAALVAACLWAFSVSHSSQYSGGHDALTPFLYAPYALLFWRRAETSKNMAVALGLLFALLFQEGATYPIPLIALMLGVETLTRVLPPRRIPRIVLAALIALVVMVIVGANRLLPVVFQLATHKRVMDWPDVDSLANLATLRDMLFFRHREWYARPAGQQYSWSEYVDYHGYIVMALAAIGLVASATTRKWWLAFVGLVLFLCMMGHSSPYAPWELLTKHVFPFKSMRVPARFRLLLVMFVASWVALAVDRVPLIVQRWTGRVNFARAVRAVLVGLALLGAGDVMGVATDQIASRFIVAHPAVPPVVIPSARLYYGGPGLAAQMDRPHQNRAGRECGNGEHWGFSFGAPIWEGDVPQARAVDDAVVVEVANRTQNTFLIDVVAARPGRILVNTAYERGWRTELGTLSELDHQLVLDLPEGRHRLKLWYEPLALRAGLWSTGVGLVLVALFFARGAIARRLSRKR